MKPFPLCWFAMCWIHVALALIRMFTPGGEVWQVPVLLGIGGVAFLGGAVAMITDR